MAKNEKLTKLRSKFRVQTLISALILIPIVLVLIVIAFRTRNMFFEFIGFILIYVEWRLIKVLFRVIFIGLDNTEKEQVRKKYIIESMGAKWSSRIDKLGELARDENSNVGCIFGDVYFSFLKYKSKDKEMGLIVYNAEHEEIVYQKTFSHDELDEFEIFMSDDEVYNLKIKAAEGNLCLAKRDLTNVPNKVHSSHIANRGGLGGMAAGVGGVLDSMSDIDAHNREVNRLAREAKRVRKLFMRFTDGDQFIITEVGKNVLGLKEELKTV